MENQDLEALDPVVDIKEAKPRESTQGKLERRTNTAIWIRVGSSLGLAYQLLWVILFGFALFRDDTCDDTSMVSFATGLFWLLIFILPFVGIMFFASVLVKIEKVYHWKSYIMATTVIITGWDLFLFIGVSVVYAGTTPTPACETLYHLFRDYIICSAVVLGITLIVIMWIWWGQLTECCCGKSRKEKDDEKDAEELERFNNQKVLDEIKQNQT